MKLRSISTSNFMSLRTFRMDNLDANMNFIVGPNGSGKTSVFRCLKRLTDAFAIVAATDLGGNAPRRDPFLADLRLQRSRDAGDKEAKIEIAVDVEFDTPTEQEMLALFFSAALLHPDSLKTSMYKLSVNMQPQEQNQSGSFVFVPDEDHITEISRWLLSRLNVDTLKPLYQGTLRLVYRPDVFDSLALSYTFMCDDTSISFSCGWTPYYVDGDLRTVAADSTGISRLPANELLFDFIDETDRQNVQRLILGQPISEHSSLTAPSLLRYVADKGTSLMVRGVALPHSYPPAHRRLSELMGTPLIDPNNHRVTFAQLMHRLLSDAFVFANTIHRPVIGSHAVVWKDLVVGTMPSEDEQPLSIRLYHLKNGNLDERNKYVRIQRGFSQVIGERFSFDVVSVPIPNAIGEFTAAEPHMALGIRIIEGDSEISLDSHGAGISELLVLASLLDDSDGHIVLLDEPAINLHPGMQRRILEHLRATPGQYFVITHSQHLLPSRASEFYKVTRLAKPEKDTHCYRLSATNMHQLKESKLEQELATSSDVGGLLFATAVILVEGDTEVATLPEWFPAISGGKSFEDLDIALYSVGSKTNFGFYIRFLEAFGVPWSVFCDGDALTTNNSLWSALSSSNASTTVMSFDQLKTTAEALGIFTPNDSAADDFELIPEVKAYIKDPANNLPSRSRVRDGRQIGQNIPCPPSIEAVLRHIVSRFQNIGVL